MDRSASGAAERWISDSVCPLVGHQLAGGMRVLMAIRFQALIAVIVQVSFASDADVD